jgi:large subunit ribosomal protein L21e
MPYKYYHGYTGKVWNVTKRALGVELLKMVNGRYIRKRIHVRIEHVTPSRCREEFLVRCAANDAAKHEAKVKGLPAPVTKRQPKGPRLEGITLENVSLETITAVPYDILKVRTQCHEARGVAMVLLPAPCHKSTMQCLGNVLLLGKG